jgi:predicted RNA binding protein YcfA (HicA-like mRNA interferase family)
MAVSRRNLVRKFRSIGFKGPYSGGKHQFMVRGDSKVRVPNPHGSGEISEALLREILHQAGISKEEWDSV